MELAVALHRAGFDGPRGLAELHHRLASLVALEVQHRAASTAAYPWIQAGRFQGSGKSRIVDRVAA